MPLYLTIQMIHINQKEFNFKYCSNFPTTIPFTDNEQVVISDFTNALFQIGYLLPVSLTFRYLYGYLLQEHL